MLLPDQHVNMDLIVKVALTFAHDFRQVIAFSMKDAFSTHEFCPSLLLTSS